MPKQTVTLQKVSRDAQSMKICSTQCKHSLAASLFTDRSMFANSTKCNTYSDWPHLLTFQSSSRMRVVNHNWSATKQRLHPQSVATIQFCQGTGFNNMRHRLGLATRTQISVCKSPFPSAGTAVSLFRAKTVQ